ncbi:hypothetical protein EDD69_10787 [Thermolongibacillus altinsuensis]|jgi:hypothetical protein|uniref:Uncharacterized protein n=1 Tax=Thermolongibacillus altinsuensis TaxID=575256 RepID=A0A4R1QG21_9BACL|nr:hypothetical protein [Thermolongibacillus altinsuensis]TCL49264.1 hypothetical protein EDD69_10787 [Thermolongibacillus altinsuensis]
MDIISIIVIVSLLLFGIWIEEKYLKELEQTENSHRIRIKYSAYKNSFHAMTSLFVLAITYEFFFGKLSYDDLRFVFSLTVGLGFITQLITIVILINRNKKKMKTTRL